MEDEGRAASGLCLRASVEGVVARIRSPEVIFVHCRGNATFEIFKIIHVYTFLTSILVQICLFLLPEEDDNANQITLQTTTTLVIFVHN